MKALSLFLAASLLAPSAFDSTAQTKRTLATRLIQSVVKLSYKEGINEETGKPNAFFCTGFIVDAAKGWVMTAKHCIPTKSDTTLYVNETIESSLVKSDESLAIVRIPAMMGPPIEFADKKPEVFDSVIAVGFGFSSMKQVERHVSALEDGDVTFDNSLTPGMSGGPIIDMNGKVVAITQATAAGVSIGCGAGEMKALIKK